MCMYIYILSIYIIYIYIYLEIRLYTLFLVDYVVYHFWRYRSKKVVPDQNDQFLRFPWVSINEGIVLFHDVVKPYISTKNW